MTTVPSLPGLTIVRRLGGGRFSDVYLAERAGHPVVLKVALEQARNDPALTDAIFFPTGRTFHTGSVGRWEPDPGEVVRREGDVLAGVAHPALVRLLDRGEATVGERTLPWLVLEHVPGRTMRAAMREAHPRWVLSAARSLLEMAAELPLHGDLKPDNLMVDGDGSVRLIDPSAGMTELDDWGGPVRMLTTPLYNPWLALSDVPALGVMLLEIRGGHPFVRTGDVAPRIGPRLAERLAAARAIGHDAGARRIEQMRLPNTGDGVVEIALACLGLLGDGDRIEAADEALDVAAMADRLGRAV